VFHPSEMCNTQKIRVEMIKGPEILTLEKGVGKVERVGGV
jgi:hypothetical protein